MKSPASRESGYKGAYCGREVVTGQACRVDYWLRRPPAGRVFPRPINHVRLRREVVHEEHLQRDVVRSRRRDAIFTELLVILQHHAIQQQALPRVRVLGHLFL